MTYDPFTYVREIREWQTEMDDRLREPDGWLTLVGLDWLDKGENPIGSGKDNKVVFPPGSAPEKVGTLTLSDDQVAFTVEPGVEAILNGEAITEKVLETDANRNQDIIHVGEVNFHVIVRGNRFGVRTKQPNSPSRLKFTGRTWWMIDREKRIEAEIIPYEPQKMVMIPDILGEENETAMDCQLKFTLDRREFTLDAMALPSGQFYILFHDESCGKGSYPSGRFLVTEYPEDDKVLIDFNKSHNPPCAFTPYATCPMPPEQNYLAIAIQAGEKFTELPGLHH